VGSYASNLVNRSANTPSSFQILSSIHSVYFSARGVPDGETLTDAYAMGDDVADREEKEGESEFECDAGDDVDDDVVDDDEEEEVDDDTDTEDVVEAVDMDRFRCTSDIMPILLSS